MPRQVATSAENNFVKGLITETTALNFPENAATEIFDCEVDHTGRVTRRLGFDLEPNYEVTSVAIINSTEAFTEYVWHGVGGNGEKSFLVQQQGRAIRFYDVSESTDVSANAFSSALDLTTFIVSGSAKLPGTYGCHYATGSGYLIITNPACKPFFVTYDVVTGVFTGTAITIQYRDFLGLADNFLVWQRPTTNLASLVTSNAPHYYNLINQSWHLGAALNDWDVAFTNLPSNSDYVAQYRASETDPFDAARVNANTGVSNTPAPKGHFILELGNADRAAALVAEGFSNISSSIVSSVALGTGQGTIIGNMTNPSRAFDGSASTEASVVGTDAWIGKTLPGAFRISQAVIRGLSSNGYAATGDPTITVTLYGKQGTAPSGSTDGTVLASTSFTDQSQNEATGRTLVSSDTATYYDHVFLRVQVAPSNTIIVSEFEPYILVTTTPSSSVAAEVTQERPSTIAFFNSRAFYAGINDAILNSNIYFTQVIEQTNQLGYCYQKNDPTSEFFSDLLPDDGGVIKILEVGQIIKLHSYQSSLLVYATNGVWMVSGSKGSPFAANDYVVRKLSSIGVNSPQSFIDMKGVPIWWGEDGIYTIKFNADYDSFECVAITDDTIATFVLDIPALNRSFVKGTYDVQNQIAYWLYNDTEELEEEDYYKYNSVLVLNGLGGAFYPWTIGDGGVDVRGIVYVDCPVGNAIAAVKYTSTIPIDASNEYLTFSEVWSNLYKDWNTYATEISGDSDDELDYLSYFITGYKIHADGTRFFQPQYVYFYLEQEENAGAYMQAIYEFTTSGNTGKWSSKQQIYNSCLTDRAVNYRRLKVRGKGRAMQFRVNSETGRPFTIIGWAARESAGQTV